MDIQGLLRVESSIPDHLLSGGLIFGLDKQFT